MARILNKAGGRKTATATATARPVAKQKAVAPKVVVEKDAPKKVEAKVAAPKTPAKVTPIAAASSAGAKVKSEHGAVTVPQRAGDLKARFAELAATINQIKALKRTLQKSFFEIGELLTKIQTERLFEVKGYGSFESFVEREIDLGTQVCLSVARIHQTLQRDAALAAGLERASAAVAALDGGSEQRETAPIKHNGMSAVPLHKQ